MIQMNLFSKLKQPHRHREQTSGCQWGKVGDWNAKLRSQETLGVTGKFGLGVQNEAGQG
jgi:hypothetical protein